MEVFDINTKTQINESIRASEVRLIGEDGSSLGIKKRKEALEIAADAGLDLVNVSPESTPPVCKIIDYGKYKFELQKKDRINRSNQKIITLKEIKLSPTIGDNDLNTKIRNAIKFLQDNHKVRLSIQFRGRAIVHQTVGKDVIERFITSVSAFSVVEQHPSLEGRKMVAQIKPK